MAFPTLYPGVAYPGAKYTFPELFPDAAAQMRCRLVAYTPFGGTRGVLPDALETQVVTPLGELPTASVHYHRAGVNAVQLDGITELGFEYFDTERWVEPPNCRFISMQGGFDHLEQERTRKYSAVGIGWMLRRAKVWEPNGLPIDSDGKVQFNSANAGKIMSTLFQNARGRGWGTGLSINFNSQVDSNGSAWKNIVTIAYALEMDLDTILTNLYQQGVCDYRWQGRTLNLFNPDTAIGRDLTLGADAVQLRVADGQTSAPEEWTNEDLLTDAMVIGEEGKQWKFTNGSATALGRLEGVITQGGVSDQGTANLLSKLDLTAGSQTRFSYTREFKVTQQTKAWPFRDYAAGDWVLGQRGTTFERLRTASLSLTVNRDGVKGHAVLGDRLDDLLSKLAKRTKGITGGASAGGSGVRPAPEGPDKRTPAIPTGVVVDADAYIDDTGAARGIVAIDWAHPGTATDGTAMDIEVYEVHYRINAVGETWQQLSRTQDSELSYSPLPIFKSDGKTPEQLAFKVRAIGRNGTPSEFTAPVVVIMENDVTPPPVPYFTAADVTTWLRTVKVEWTGKGTINGSDQVAMPRDFAKVNVYRGSSPTGPWTLVDSAYTTVGLVHQSGSMPLATVWYALTSVDRSDNESSRSAAYPITPKANVDIKEITDVIDGSMLGENSVDYVALLASDQMWAKLAQFVEIRAGMIAANAITTDTIEAGAVTAGKVAANAIEATQIKGDAITAKHTLTGALYQSNPEPDRGIKISTSGIRGYNNVGERTLAWFSDTGSLVAAKGSLTGMLFQTTELLDRGMKIDSGGIRGYNDLGERTLAWFSDTGSLIASKGSLTGMLFQTQAEANRGMKLDTNGLRFYDGEGRLRMNATATAATFTGKVTSGFDPNLQAVLADNIFSGQSGTQFNVGGGFQYQPFIVGWSNNNMFQNGHGMLHLSSARNGADYSQLLLSREGTWELGSTTSRILGSDNQLQLRAPGGADLDLISTGAYLSFGNQAIAVTNGGISLSSLEVAGAKNFVMDHPSRPGMELLHGATESPVSGIEYWGDDQIGADGHAVIDLPDYFEDLAKARNRTVLVVGNGSAVSWSKITDGTIAVTGEPGTEFGWLVKAERFGGDFTVERWKEPVKITNHDTEEPWPRAS